MIKKNALRLLGISLLGVCWAAGGNPVASAEPAGQDAQSGATTYFPQSGKPSAGAQAPSSPATTAAIPTPSDPPKDVKTEVSSPPKPEAPAATAAVTPPVATTPVTEPAPASGPAPEKKPETPAPAAPTDTAIVTPPAEKPASAPAPSTESKPEPATETKPAAAEPAPSTPPANTAAQPKPGEPATPVVAAPPAPPAPPPLSPVVEAARAALSDKSLAGRNNVGEDVTAARDYYAAHTEPLWVKGGEFSRKAKDIISTLKSADDWGLESSDFIIPRLENGTASEGAAEAQLTLSALKYARFARGGRLDPVSLSNILDMKPPVKDARTAMREIANASDPGSYLRGLNPKHVGFERLRQALLKARGGQEVKDEEPIDPALLVKLPKGKNLKPGAKDDQIALLRQRLKIPADNPADDRVYDSPLVDAVRNFQQENGLKANGVLSNRVRDAMNSVGQPKKRLDPSRNVDRILSNMERWRWLPTDLGKFYVMNNIPEFTSEIWSEDRIELKQRMIVGQPSWPTPLLTAKMQFVIFKPSWGMPDGIKAKELGPRLRQASGNSGFGFFDQLFGGGGYTASDVIDAYKLQVYYGGQRVDPKSINWKTADLRQYSFIQPPGQDNPLGLVKFRFPNRHDVYMHDTPERNLFSQNSRALSHGCMRVQEPRRTAEVILARDKGYSPEKVGELWDSGASITLTREVPVYLVYFTARGTDDGEVENFSDIYGIDDRIMSALRGRPVRFVAQEAIDPTEASAPGGSGGSYDAGSDNLSDSQSRGNSNSYGNTNSGANRTTSKKQKKDTLQDALSNIFLN